MKKLKYDLNEQQLTKADTFPKKLPAFFKKKYEK